MSLTGHSLRWTLSIDFKCIPMSVKQHLHHFLSSFKLSLHKRTCIGLQLPTGTATFKMTKQENSKVNLVQDCNMFTLTIYQFKMFWNMLKTLINAENAWEVWRAKLQGSHQKHQGISQNKEERPIERPKNLKSWHCKLSNQCMCTQLTIEQIIL